MRVMRRAMFFEMEFQEQCPKFMMLSELDGEIVFYFRSEICLLFLRSKVLQTFAQKNYPALPFGQRG